MLDPSKESGLGRGGLLGSDRSALGTGGLLHSDARRLSAAGEIVLEQLRRELHEQNTAQAGSDHGQVTVDNGDNTYTVVLAAGGGTLEAVPAQPGVLIFVNSWYALDRSGPGWVISGPDPYHGGTA